MSYTSEVLADSPVMYYRLGESSGTTMTDSSGGGHNGTYSGPPTLGATGLLASDPTNTAISCNGTANQYGLVSYGTFMDAPTALTVEAWIKVAGGTGTRIIADRDQSGGRCWSFFVNNSGKLAFTRVGTGPSAPTLVNDGAAHHVVATWDGTTVRLYVDGNLDNSQSYAATTITGNSALAIGEGFAGGGSPPAFSRFNGTIDEVAIYNSVLSATRIAAHYTAGTTAAAPSASGSASLTVSASGSAAASAAGSASLSLSATGSPVAAAAGSASLTISASGEGLGPGQAAGDATLTLTASGAAGASASGAASLSLSASGAARARAAGAASLTLSAHSTAGSLGPYPDAVLTDSPIAYWRLGDATDTGFPTTAHDSTGNGHDGTYDAGLSSTATGAIAGDADKATYFGGSAAGTHDMQVPFWAGLNTAQFTYETWVQLNSFPSDNPLFGRTGNPGPVHVSTNASGNVAVHVNSGTTSATYTSTTPAYYYGDGYHFHHVAISRDSAGTLRIYVDGALSDEFANSLAPSTSTSEGFEIGTYGGIGTLDEMALYDYALPADRVFAHYLIGHGASGAASLSLSASGTVTGASARSTATLTLSALGQVPTPATGMATLELFADGLAVAVFATDLSNALDGIDLLLSATVKQFTPVGAAPAGLAERYDVAIPYPAPVMVDGRPT